MQWRGVLYARYLATRWYAAPSAMRRHCRRIAASAMVPTLISPCSFSFSSRGASAQNKPLLSRSFLIDAPQARAGDLADDASVTREWRVSGRKSLIVLR